MHEPTDSQWQVAKQVLQYLKGTICHGLFLRSGQSLVPNAFSDSNWGGVTDGGRSTTTYILYFGSNVISWKSACQKSVSRSSTEVEYRAVANATIEVLWVQSLLRELRFPLYKSTELFCDNLSATYVCQNPVFHSRMKHLTLDYFFV